MTGEITSSATFYPTMAALELVLDGLSTGAATAGADITTFKIVPDSMKGFWLVIITRAS